MSAAGAATILAAAAWTLSAALVAVWVTGTIWPALRSVATLAGLGLAVSSCWLAADVIRGNTALTVIDTAVIAYCAWAWHHAVLAAARRRAGEPAAPAPGEAP